MHQQISKSLFFLFHNYLRPDEKLKNLNRFRERQWISQDEMTCYQTAKLRDLLSFAYYRSAYYRAAFDRAGFHPQEFKSHEDLCEIPFLTKAIIRENKEHILCKNLGAESIVSNSTSGSTGESLYFFSDKRGEQVKAPLVFRGYEWLELPIGSREMRIWGSQFDVERERRVKERIFNFFNNRLVISSHQVSQKSIRHLLELFKRFKPDFLFSYPSTLIHFAHLMDKNGIDHDFDIKRILVSGEQLYHWQRVEIEKAFDTPVYNFYGCREVGMIAQECLCRQGMHVIPENVYVEVINRSGKPVVEEEGDIVVTDLNNRVMPFIHYRIGDRGRVLPRQCACGRDGMPLLEVNGRKFDIITSPEGDAVGGTFWTLLFKSRPGIKQFQVVQESIHKIRIDYVPDGNQDLDDGAMDYFNGEIQSRLRGISTTYHRVEHIHSKASGKQQFVVNLTYDHN